MPTIEEFNSLQARYPGFVVHPLSSPQDKGNSPGKRPLISKWQDLERTPENIEDYIKKGCNLGLQCGRRSNVIVIDFDHELFTDFIFNGFELKTLMSGRTNGRGHVYFAYTEDIKASKHHDLGIEILSDGSNAVLPPSVHNSGDVYKWKGAAAPLMMMPVALIDNLNKLFKTEAELKQYLSKCRHCFRDAIKNKPNVHGAEGREYMLALCTDLKAAGAGEEHIKIFSRIMYGPDYNEERTLTEWRNIDKNKTWRCEKIKEKLPSYIDLLECEKCENKKQNYQEFKEGKKSKKIKEPVYLPEIPTEEISREPITIEELLTTYRKYQYIEEEEEITIPLSEVISNFAPIEPDIVGIIGASGCGKTEVIRALGELENQFVYPVSSITGHTLVSGFEDNVDLAPSLRNRLLTIKDFTTLLAKKSDEVSEIFADLRELTDGHIGKDFGSGVKKHYTGIHTSILFGCTNAIEKYNSMFSLLGQRITFFRPKSNRKKAMMQAMKNAGKETAFRDELHKTTLQFINYTLINKKERLTNLSHIQDDYKNIIGELVLFLSIVRTHIDRDFKGDMARLPEPEYPTRLAKTFCKLVDAHSILYDREPTEDDLNIAYRLILDNIPTERLRILNALINGEERTTTEVQTEAKVSNGFARRVLEDLKALEIIEGVSLGAGHADIWILNNEDYRQILIKIQNFGKHENTKPSPDSEQERGVKGKGEDIKENEVPFLKVLHKINNNNNNSPSSHPVSGLPPEFNQDAETHQKKDNIEKDPFLIKKIKTYIIESYNDGNRPTREGWDIILRQVMADHNLTMSTAMEYIKAARLEMGPGW